MMYLRKAVFSDLPRISAIIDGAKAALKERGVNQWQAGDPSESQFENDIRQEYCYILIKDDTIVGVASIVDTVDDGYSAITNGDWQSVASSHPYYSIHRMALDGSVRGQHLAHQLMTLLITAASIDGAHDVRIDTHPDNLAMQHVIQKAGFTYCGDILIADDPSPKRFAYQLVLK
ncbi:putative N-acetyltransferase, GNAT family [Latilactobacillus sakei]|nr:N-acetyltransferase [Latilactobacillus sakei]GEP21485.1 N-acetyltransferase [Latilactobacillus sakei subsp. carnosus]UNC21004.1 GNAT family N-acetyltransferase [Latilactobacillus sakei]UNC22735.1 GNAT family N-acetyltransferase [Latilactobacillus sakei]SOB40745.1 putative N-acetyltransferase, GNAT family [Latilactobacillus sakei]